MSTVTDGPHEEPEKASTAPKKEAQGKRNGSARDSDGVEGRKNPREVRYHFQNLIPDRPLSTRDQQLLQRLMSRSLPFPFP